MKKVYAAAVALLFTGAVFGQSNMQVPQVPKSQHQKVEASVQSKFNTPLVQSPSAPATAQSTPAVYFSDDFSVPGNWTVGHANGTQGDWVIGTAPLAFVGVVNSTSGGNFGGFDSDVLGQGTTNNAWIQTANPINLATVPAVQLNWQQSYMRFQDNVYIEVSSNGGTSWTTYQVNDDITTNQQTPNPDFRSLDISSAAANEPAVLIRFRYEGAWDYAWAIDDIEILDPPANDLVAAVTYFNSYADTTSTWHYSQIPLQHSLLDTMIFGAAVRNAGSVQQDNVLLDVTISGQMSWSDTSPAGVNIGPGLVDSVEAPSIFIASQLGDYDIDFSVSSDSTDSQPLNNSLMRSWTVSDTVYARDFDDFAGGFSYAAGTSTHQMALLYEIRTTETINSMDIQLFSNGPDGTTDGAVVNFHIYDNSFTPVASVNFETIDNSWFNDWHTVQFDPPFTATPGIYMVGYETLNATDEVWIGQGSIPNISPPVTAFVNIDNGGWGWIDATPMLRMNVAEFVNPCSAAIVGNTTDISCNGANDGAVDLSVGGNGPFTYTWSNGMTTEDISGLAGGSYTVVIEWDTTNNCVDSATFTIAEPLALAVDTIATVAEECGAADGSATATGFGGTTPYSYLWNNGSMSSTASGLSGGSYTVTITDNNGCTASMSAAVSGSLALMATDSTTNAACGVSDGSGTMTVTQGVAPYTYMWSNGATTATADSLSAGSYTVTISDSLGCSNSYSVNISNINAPSVSITSTTNVLCNGNATGSLTVTAVGGGPFDYAWTSGDTTDTAMNLAAGTYTVTVADTALCISIIAGTITEPTAIALSGTSTNISCAGQTDGSIDVTLSGGVSPYTYAWSNSMTTEDISGLGAGSYTVVIADGNSCPDSMSFTITEPGVLTATTTPVDIACFGNTNGAVSLNVSGGTNPMTYNWSNGVTNQNISSIGAGDYTVSITDANGCTTTSTATVAQPAAGISSSATVVDEDQGNPGNGSIDLTVTGGVSPYSFVWSGTAANVEDPGSLSGGVYTVTITDANNCTATNSATVGSNVSIDEATKRVFSVFPNPNNGVFNVAFGNVTGRYNVTVYDMVGKVVYSEAVTLNGSVNREMNLTNLGQGMYFLSVEGADSKSIERIVIR
jgi:hypothetical protein